MSLLDKLDLDDISRGAIIDGPLAALLSALDAPADLSTPTPLAPVTAVALPGVLGSNFTGSVTVSANASVAPVPATVTIALDGVTLTLPAAAHLATRTETGTGRQRRIRYLDAGAPVALGVTGHIIISLSKSEKPSIDVTQLTLLTDAKSVVLPGGIGITLPLTISAIGDRFQFVGAEFVLPQSVPTIGGIACQADLQCGRGPFDLDLAITPAPVGLGESPPAVDGTLSWHLSDAESFDQLVPTGASVTLDLPTGDGLLGASGAAIATSLRVRVGMSRPPDEPGALSITVTMESDEPTGLLSVVDTSPGAIAAGITVALAPAIRAGSPASTTAALFATAAVIGSELAVSGGFLLHGVTLDASTQQLGAVHALLDIEGVVTADLWKSGPLAIGMRPDARPLRVRWRDVSASVDPTRNPGDMLTLDFARARIEVVDPGEWTVQTPGSLLDVVGTRSGHGSTWFEVDLRFVIDLGPVTISGATIRATFDGGGLSLGLRGLLASIDVPGLLTGEGQVFFTDTGFSVVLGVEVPSLGLAALGFLRYDELPQGPKVEIGFAVDLPGPIPLGPTGLGLYGVLGTFGYNAVMPPLDPANPFLALRRWKPWQPLVFGADDVTIGIGVSIGTAPDNGFFFSALGVFGVTVPDFALRIGVDGHLLAARKSITRSALDELCSRVGIDGQPPPNPPEISVFGGVAASSEALDAAVAGTFSIPYLVEVKVPLAAHFPFRDGNWWVRTGSDDGIVAPTNRPPGPITAKVFPGTPFECGGWAFLMVHGAGINTPSLMGDKDVPATTGFTIGVGAGIEVVIGAKGILWAEITSSLTALISTRPELLRVHGQLSGTLGIGPFHVGLSADVTLQVWTDAGGAVQYAYKLEICGEIDLLFDTLRKCITVNTLDAAPAPLPPVPGPDDWPWPDVLLADGLGRSLPATDASAGSPQRPAAGSGLNPDGGWAQAPIVWPDVVPILSFPIAPVIGTTAITSPSPAVNLGQVSSGGATITWTLQNVQLDDVTTPGAIAPVQLHDTSRWQVPAGTGTWPAGTSNARELVLLRRTLLAWAAHVAGDGSQLRPMMDPAQLIGGACLWTAPSGPGWAVGGDGRPAGRIWNVPAERSEWGASVLSSFSNGTGFTVGTVPVSPRGLIVPALPPTTISGGPSALRSEAVADGRRFERGFRLTSSVFVAPLASTAMRTTLALDEPVIGGRLHLLVSVTDFQTLQGFPGIAASARSTSGATVTPSLELGARSADGFAVVVTVVLPPSAADPIAAIVLELPWGLPALILGLVATTARDDAAATAGQTAQDAAKSDDAKAAADPSRLSQLLTPGHRYRLTVALGWDSALNVPGVAVTPANSGPVPIVRSWYFATAGKDPAPPSKPSTPKQVRDLEMSGSPSGYSSQWTLVESSAPVLSASGAFIDAQLAISVLLDTFKPGYLARYVKGFTPADHTEFLFPADHPGIEFLAMHIVELAGLYDRDVGMLVRRLDQAAPDIYTVPFPQPAKSKPKFALAAAVELAANNAGCLVPPTESTLTVAETLQRGASYELSCVLPEAGDAHPDKWTPSLGGITFTTSNFADPANLIRSFGFEGGISANAHTHGDFAVRPVAGAPGWVQDDAELERLIDALGLPPLRPVDANRSSVLWVPAPGGAWAVTGLLLQSTEPLVRDGGRRMGIGQAYLSGTELPVRRSNLTATAVLWLTTTPLVLGDTATLELRASDRLTSFSGRVTVVNPPRFSAATLSALEEK